MQKALVFLLFAVFVAYCKRDDDSQLCVDERLQNFTLKNFFYNKIIKHLQNDPEIIKSLEQHSPYSLRFLDVFNAKISKKGRILKIDIDVAVLVKIPKLDTLMNKDDFWRESLDHSLDWYNSTVVQVVRCNYKRGPRDTANPKCKKLKKANKHEMATQSYSNKISFTAFQIVFNQLYIETNCSGSKRLKSKSMAVFEKNLDYIRKLRRTENFNSASTYGVTKFATLTKKEFSKTYLGLSKFNPGHILNRVEFITKEDQPSSVDWREKGKVTEVKNQGRCGSCWAFSTTGNVEGQYAIKHNNLKDLSEQELVDCDQKDDGCNGGLPMYAYQSIEKLGGLETEKNYPYTGEKGKCGIKAKDQVVKVTGYVNVSTSEDQIAAFIAEKGPVSAGINAFAMQFYTRGIAKPWFCRKKKLDHGVLIVGYGTQKSEPYWIIKNSWGKDWGEDGYYRLYRGNGLCGINLMVTSSTVA